MLGAAVRPLERVAAPCPSPSSTPTSGPRACPKGSIASSRIGWRRDRGDLLREPLDPPAPPGPRRALAPGRVPGRSPGRCPRPGQARGRDPGARTARQPLQRHPHVPGLSLRSPPTPARPRARRTPTRSIPSTSRAPRSRSFNDLNPDELDDVRFAEAFKSAAGFRDDALTTRFAAELLRRKPAQLHQLDLSDGLRAAGPPGNAAEQPRRKPSTGSTRLEPGSESSRTSFDTWRAEILSRTGRPEEAARIYDDLVASSSSRPQVALDAAETLPGQRPLRTGPQLPDAPRDLAHRPRVTGIEDLANRHLKGLA